MLNVSNLSLLNHMFLGKEYCLVSVSSVLNLWVSWSYILLTSKLLPRDQHQELPISIHSNSPTGEHLIPRNLKTPIPPLGQLTLTAWGTQAVPPCTCPNPCPCPRILPIRAVGTHHRQVGDTPHLQVGDTPHRQVGDTPHRIRDTRRQLPVGGIHRQVGATHLQVEDIHLQVEDIHLPVEGIPRLVGVIRRPQTLGVIRHREGVTLLITALLVLPQLIISLDLDTMDRTAEFRIYLTGEVLVRHKQGLR